MHGANWLGVKELLRFVCLAAIVSFWHLGSEEPICTEVQTRRSGRSVVI